MSAAAEAPARGEPRTPGPLVPVRSLLNQLWSLTTSDRKKVASVVDPYGYDIDVAEANARFIARAWNHHDDLVDVLDGLLKQVDLRCGGRIVGNSPLVAAADTARALLDKVRAES